MTRHRTLFAMICIVLALAVAMGAFGAHALEQHMNDQQQHTWETATRYHFIHGLGALIFLLFAMRNPSRYFIWAIRLLLIGILLFSGSLYLLAVQSALGMSLSWLGPVTPVGGVVFIAGWLTAIPGFKEKK